MIKGFSETIKNEVKGQVVFLGMLLSTLGANLLGNMLAGKGIIRAGEGRITAGEGATRAGQDFYCRLISKYRKHQNEPKFNGVYSRNSLPTITDGAYVISMNR